jgi:hypothetical protein
MIPNCPNLEDHRVRRELQEVKKTVLTRTSEQVRSNQLNTQQA